MCSPAGASTANSTVPIYRSKSEICPVQKKSNRGLGKVIPAEANGVQSPTAQWDWWLAPFQGSPQKTWMLLPATRVGTISKGTCQMWWEGEHSTFLHWCRGVPCSWDVLLVFVNEPYMDKTCYNHYSRERIMAVTCLHAYGAQRDSLPQFPLEQEQQLQLCISKPSTRIEHALLQSQSLFLALGLQLLLAMPGWCPINLSVAALWALLVQTLKCINNK